VEGGPGGGYDQRGTGSGTCPEPRKQKDEMVGAEVTLASVQGLQLLPQSPLCGQTLAFCWAFPLWGRVARGCCVATVHRPPCALDPIFTL
jgi:hypothetical protein